MTDILLISDDVAGRKMAGPGIRAWELSRCLAERFRVVLAVPDYSRRSPDEGAPEGVQFEIVHYSPSDSTLIEKIGEKSRIIITQGYILSKFPVIKTLPAHLICDLYVPFPLENLFIHQKNNPNLKDREHIHTHDLAVFNDQIAHGDHFLCASLRQRDLFAGSLLSKSRIDPHYVDRSITLDSLISVVPFGIRPEAQGERKAGGRDILGAKFPQIRSEDLLLLWGGVLTNWFDPKTLIRAVDEAAARDPRIKLLFLSTGHANPLLPEFDMAREAMSLSEDLGLTGKRVFFNHEWVDYRDRGDYFAAADIGVSIHRNHFETYYAFRTRILDYIKYRLPIICTEGDYFSELVAGKDLGIAVRSESVEDLTAAILRLAKDMKLREDIRERLKAVREDFYWDRACEPLVQYCRKVLSGEERKKREPEKNEKRRLKGAGRKYLRHLFQRLPMRISSRIRRVLKI